MGHGRQESWRAWILPLVCAGVALYAACSLLRRDVHTPEAVLAKAPGAERIGSISCTGCHDAAQVGIGSTVHGSLPLDGDSAQGLCESCHGPGGTHSRSMDPSHILVAEDLERLENQDRSSTCLSCHRAMASRWWSASPHADTEISCWNCHPDAIHAEVQMQGPVVAPAVLEPVTDRGAFCFQCHVGVEQEFLMQVVHPVAQGRAGCLDCHGVHGEPGTIEGDGEAEQVCTRCHVEVAGPWIFEHDALFEGCTSCHAPHGSPNPKLLVQTGNGLCLSCHIEATFPDVAGVDHSAYLGSGATCIQCHFEVHGSNASEILAPGF